MNLQAEIDKARAEIRTDGYAMSIGEWISLYEKKELDIHPEFQRFFRWTPKQKSRLIESILLGIPIPQIFVAQRPDGVWDVVDGLQRLSTIFQFVGVLRDEKDSTMPPLTLEATKYLPSLGGLCWQADDQPEKALTNAQQLLIKRAKIGASIILRESDDLIKFELFQRLNTGGSPLSDQELRNSLLVMLNPELFRWIKSLADDANFQDCVALSDRLIEEQYAMELVLRFLIFSKLPINDLRNIGHLGDFLTDRTTELAGDKTFDKKAEEEAFRTTFILLSKCLGSDSFRRYDQNRDRFLGGFLISAFEVVALGIGYNYKQPIATPDTIPEKVKGIWSTANFTKNSGAGVPASTRIPNLIPLGRKLFSQ